MSNILDAGTISMSSHSVEEDSKLEICASGVGLEDLVISDLLKDAIKCFWPHSDHPAEGLSIILMELVKQGKNVI